MNHIRQYKLLEKQLQSYKDFVPFCDFDDLPKLTNEMLKIHNRIEKIKEYRVDKLIAEVVVQYEIKESRINLK